MSATSAWRVPAERSGEKKLTALDTSGVTHCLHSACVASGASGGPLANARGEAVGVHSFGDAFYGATRDVAVLCDAATCADGLGFDGAHRRGAGGEVCAEAYATRRVNENIARTSDPALKQMCPELSEAQRKAWIL